MKNIVLRTVDSKNIYGTMNGGTIRYSNLTDADKKFLMNAHNLSNLEEVEVLELTKEDKGAIFKAHRLAFGEGEGIDWKKMFMADQTTKNGSHFELTDEYVEANPNGWSDIAEDILIITNKTPEVVAGHPVADCPVVIVEDKKQGITAVCHCSAELIDKKLPILTAEALLSNYDSKKDDLYVSVSPCAGPNWTYNNWPNWATDKKLWEESQGLTVDKDNIYHINLRNVIKAQMGDMNIENVSFSNVDTITDDLYYSNSAASPYGLNNPNKHGRNFIGAVYQAEQSKGKSK